MDRQELIKELSVKNDTKLLMVVLDGVGDIPLNGKTPLQAAKKPNLDKLAAESELGLTVPVIRGITPGSGPGHLGLFGYDPLKYRIGRGILEALGIDVEVGENDLVARANFATIEGETIVDRRAGRPSTEVSSKIVEKLSKKIKEIDGVKISLYPGKEHRFVVKFTGKDLDERLSDADPQKEGKPILFAEPQDEHAKKTAEIVNKFMKKVREVLADEEKMNFALLRGFSKHPDMLGFSEAYKLSAGAIATYPMYRGLAKLVGMNVLNTGSTISDEVKTLKEHWNDYNFFFFHVKKTDSYGEDGDFDKKVKVIEEFDKYLPSLLELKPDVVVVVGDHSTPVPIKSHSWHTVPFMITSKYVRKGANNAYDEFECSKGVLGVIDAVDILPLMLANGLRLEKFGA